MDDSSKEKGRRGALIALVLMAIILFAIVGTFVFSDRFPLNNVSYRHFKYLVLALGCVSFVLTMRAILANSKK